MTILHTWLARGVAMARNNRRARPEELAELRSDLARLVPRSNEVVAGITGQHHAVPDTFDVVSPRVAALRNMRKDALTGRWPLAATVLRGWRWGGDAQHLQALFDDETGSVSYVSANMLETERLEARFQGPAVASRAMKIVRAVAVTHEQTHPWQLRAGPRVFARFAQLRQTAGSGMYDAVAGWRAAQTWTGGKQEDLVDEAADISILFESHASYVQRVDERRLMARAGLTKDEPLVPVEASSPKLFDSAYTAGLPLIDTVVRRAGMPAFNQVWKHPENVPTAGEWRDPAKWMDRVLRADPRPRRAAR